MLIPKNLVGIFLINNFLRYLVVLSLFDNYNLLESKLKLMVLLIVALIVLFLNIPFGYWRAKVKKFSLQWFLAVHIPVPFIIALRIYSHIGFAWQTYVYLVTAYFLGHRIGSFIFSKQLK